RGRKEGGARRAAALRKRGHVVRLSALRSPRFVRGAFLAWRGKPRAPGASRERSLMSRWNGSANGQREEKIVWLATGGQAPDAERVACTAGNGGRGEVTTRLRSVAAMVHLSGRAVPARPRLHRRPVAVQGRAPAEDSGKA